MAKGGRNPGRASLLSALNAFRLANQEIPASEEIVLKRLLNDRRAAAAFAVVPLEATRGSLLVLTCLQAAEILKIFDQEVARSNRLLGSARKEGELDRLEKGLRAIDTFLKTLLAQPVGRIRTQHTLPSGMLESISNNFLLLQDILGTERRIAQETPRRLGATRKVGKGAAELAALGWIAEGFRRVVGKTDWDAVAQLAEVVLGKSVTADRIREAERTRNEREWRMPLNPRRTGKASDEVVRVRRTRAASRSSADAQLPRLTPRSR